MSGLITKVHVESQVVRLVIKYLFCNFSLLVYFVTGRVFYKDVKLTLKVSETRIGEHFRKYRCSRTSPPREGRDLMVI